MAAQSEPAQQLATYGARTRQQIGDGALAWVYLGHGQRTTLDYVAGPHGPEPILSVADAGQLRCGGRCPLAMLIACYTGAFDGPRDSLAEELLLAEEGPVAVVAATRISMPYGNAVFGYELLRASLTDRPETLGAAMRLAQQRTLSPRPDDALRKSLDSLAGGLSPLLQHGEPRWQPADLAIERSEHVAMYHLLGDPLLAWRRPGSIDVRTPADLMPGEILTIEGNAEIAGECLVELAPSGAAANVALASVTSLIQAGPFRISIAIPANASGRLVSRVYIRNDRGSAVGGTSFNIRLPTSLDGS